MRSRLSLALAVIALVVALSTCGGEGPPKPVPQPPKPTPTPPSPTVTQGDWYTYRHDTRRTACSGVVGPQNPQILFSVPGWGAALFDPIFASDNTAYVLYGEDASLGAVRNGEPLWILEREEAGEHLPVGVTTDGYLVAIGQEPGWDSTEAVQCYSADGQLLWEFPVEYVFGCPTVDDNGSIYFCGDVAGDDFAFLALTASGDERWRIPLGSSDLMPVQAIAPDGDIVATLPFGMTFEHEGPTVMKIDTATSEILWEQVVSTYYSSPLMVAAWDASPPVVAQDGTIYVVDLYGVYAYAPDGSELWTYSPFVGDRPWEEGPTPWEGWPPALGPEGNIYVTLMEETETYATALIALNSSGELLWRRDEHFEGAPIVDAAGTVYMGSGYMEMGYILASMSQVDSMQPRNIIFAINADGSTKWEFSAPEELEVEQVWCMDNEGNLVVSGRDPDGDPWEERLYWVGDAR